MNQQTLKCSSKKHENIEAITFCQACKVYMCNKCSNYHSELFEDHKANNLDKDTQQIFTGICNEEKHKNELEFLCKSHNILCCAACLSKIKNTGNGQHKDCDVCNIEEIKEEKQNKLNENIKYLEDLSKTIENSINELKIIVEKINKSKEDLKLKIQNIFTNIRNTLNTREDELLAEVDAKYNEIYFNEDIIKQIEKLPNKVKLSLEKGKLIENEWNEEKFKLNSLLNDCINIENNIKEIKILNENIIKYKAVKGDIVFLPQDDDLNSFLKTIKNFGIVEMDKDINIYLKMIKNQVDEFKNKNINPKLIYDAHRDGQNYANCHSKCNNVPNTLSLIITNKDKKFGLFRSIAVNGQGPWRSDDNAFFISFNKKTIYRMKKNTDAIAFDDDCFIQTKPFSLTGNILSQSYNCPGKDSMNKYFEGFTENSELTCGESNFTVKKFEIYQLES